MLYTQEDIDDSSIYHKILNVTVQLDYMLFSWVVGCWHGYLSWVKCRFASGPADTTGTHCLLLLYIQIGFTFLAPAHPGSSGQRAVKWLLLLLFREYIKMSPFFSHNIMSKMVMLPFIGPPHVYWLWIIFCVFCRVCIVDIMLFQNLVDCWQCLQTYVSDCKWLCKYCMIQSQHHACE